MSIDLFTRTRLAKLLNDWLHKHGRDICMAELVAAGFEEPSIDRMVRAGIITKYQVTAQGGRRENRFKLSKDWRSLNL